MKITRKQPVQPEPCCADDKPTRRQSLSDHQNEGRWSTHKQHNWNKQTALLEHLHATIAPTSANRTTHNHIARQPRLAACVRALSEAILTMQLWPNLTTTQHTRLWGGTKPLHFSFLQLCDRESSSVATSLVLETICEATSAILRPRRNGHHSDSMMC